MVLSDANPFYLGTFLVYLLIVLAIGAWAYLRTETIDDFWVYGKELGPGLGTATYVAQFVSAVSVIGFIGAIYGDGYSVLTGIVFGLVLGTAALYFVVGRVRELDQITLPDIIADITGAEWSRPITATVLLGNAWAYLIMQLVGASLLVTTITGVPYRYMVWLIGGVFILYTVLGGLVSVAYTDLIQASIMVTTVAVVFAYFLVDLGGLGAINTQFAAVDSTNVAPLGDGTYTLFGLGASLIAFFGTTFTSQNQIILINATRNVRTAKAMLAASSFVLAIFYVLLVLVGAGTTVALVDAGLAVDNPDLAFPVLITEYLPTTIGTIIVLAVLSAILSTTDTYLHSTGVTTARDIYDYFDPDASDERLMRVSRLATIVFGITATAIAVDPPGTLIAIYEFRAILLTSAFLVPIYGALYLRGVPGTAVLAAMLVGTAIGVGWEALGNPLGVPATILAVVTGAALLGAGVAVRRRRPDVADRSGAP
ncbi:Na+:solute symporter [Natronococcus pandeyae]|uniref:Na+:solute symporter n=1 Tax=Natronococcus pandeyae TaxID=2055836 RepID=A0A8J8Q402_9EURY|nr:sodium:solute symporter family protein [Natronococcus pandeyae]TYL38449.1 Na+:solute symporter [Natronococcus pandeyae]